MNRDVMGDDFIWEDALIHIVDFHLRVRLRVKIDVHRDVSDVADFEEIITGGVHDGEGINMENNGGGFAEGIPGFWFFNNDTNGFNTGSSMGDLSSPVLIVIHYVRHEIV